MAQIIIPILITTAISLLASYLMRPKEENPVQDEKPSTVASRGSFIPLLLGRRRIGPTVGWVGRHRAQNEGGGGKGSGGGGGKQRIHYEKGWHILCVGPAYALWEIIVSGKVIWKGPIYRATTPSGSTVDTGKHGSFRIYWGDVGQPIDSVLSNNVEIDSRWEYLCYIVWNHKRLGPSRVWPMIDYVVEVRPEYSLLSDSPSWNTDTYAESDRTRRIYSIYGPGGPKGDNYIQLRNKRTDEFGIGVDINMSGNVVNADGTYTGIGATWDKITGFTYVFVNETLTDDIRTFSHPAYTPTGTIAPFVPEGIDGCNPAHMLYQLLFATYPHGLGYSTDDFSLDSLESLGELMLDELYLGSFLAKTGEEALGAVAAVMQDVGCFLRWNVKIGKFEFVPIRKPTVTPPHLDHDSLASALPQIETTHGERQRSRMLFAFPDRTKNFRTNTVSRDNDALADSRGHMKTISIQIPTTINYKTAVQVSERRSQEEFGNFATLKIDGNKECRALLPGDSLTLIGVEPVLRILETQIYPLRSRIELGCAIDFYGVAASTFEDQQSGGESPETESPGQTPFQMVEVPAFLKTASNFDIITPYLRQNDEVNAGLVHISRDGLTYQNVHTEQGIQTGGELREPIAIDDPTYIVEGPEFEVIGPDISEIADLTGDDENWRLGRQLMICNGEIFYIKKITAVSGDIYRADGLVRARYDTVKESHLIGDIVYIFDQRNIKWFDDILLVPDKTLYVKVQPEGSDTIDLADLGAESYTLHGKGIKPMDPRNLRTADMRQVWYAGGDVDLKWTYMSAAYLNACAGLQGAGEPHSKPPVPGEFVLRLYTTGDVLQAEVSEITDPEYTITNAALVSAFGSEPSSFKAGVSLVNSGYESNELIITITRI